MSRDILEDVAFGIVIGAFIAILLLLISGGL